MRLAQAFRVFFRILGDAAFAERIARVELPSPSPASADFPPSASKSTPTVASSQPSSAPAAGRGRRNDALALLAVLQREGRLVDFLLEPIDAYSDAQIGSAAREVHRGCRQVVERLFDPKPALGAPEGQPYRVEKDYDPGRVRLIGQVAGSPPYSGTVVHPGWEAKRCDLPEWTGSDGAARVIAPAEIEIR